MILIYEYIYLINGKRVIVEASDAETVAVPDDAVLISKRIAGARAETVRDSFGNPIN